MKRKILISFSILSLCWTPWFPGVTVSAEETTIEIPGKVYSFDEDNDYEYQEEENYDEAEEGTNTFGRFTISADLTPMGLKDETPSYYVNTGKASFTYTYDTALRIVEDDEEWHLGEDDNDDVADIELDEDVNR